MNIERLHDVKILASPHTVLFTPDGKQLVGAGSALWLYDFSGNVVHTFRKPSGYGVSSVFATRTSLVAKCSSTIRKWNWKTRALEAELVPKALGYHVLASVSADGRRALTTTQNKAFHVWDLATGALVATTKEKKSFVVSAALSADGETVAYGGTDGVVRFFDVASKEPAGRAQSRGWIEVAARSDDGRFFATAGRAGVVSIWTRAGGLHRELAQGGKSRYVPPNGSRRRARHAGPGRVEREEGRRVATIDDRERSGLLGGTRAVRFSNDGKRIVTMGNDCRAVVSRVQR